MGADAAMMAQAGETIAGIRALGLMYPASALLATIPQQLRIGKYFRPFSYTFQFLTLAASATSSTSFTISNDADFVAGYAQCECRDATDATLFPAPPVTVFFQNSGVGYNLMQTAMPFSQVFGDAQNPGIMYVPYCIERSATITVTITPATAAPRP